MTLIPARRCVSLTRRLKIAVRRLRQPLRPGRDEEVRPVINTAAVSDAVLAVSHSAGFLGHIGLLYAVDEAIHFKRLIKSLNIKDERNRPLRSEAETVRREFVQVIQARENNISNRL